MTYSRSRNAFHQVENYLDQMLEAEIDLEWETIGDPNRFAYLLRQGIQAAKKLSLPHGNLVTRYKIHCRDGKVIAKRRVGNVIAIPVGKHERVFHDVETLSGMISVVIDQTKLNSWKFPNFFPNAEEREDLDTYCSRKDLAYSATKDEGLNLWRK